MQKKALDINDQEKESEKGGFDSPTRYTQRGMTIMPFRFLNIDTVQNPVQQLSGKNITYKPPKLRKGAKEWYIEYYFRVPAKIRHLHDNKVWKKFRVFEDINRVKTDEYANALLRAVEIGLEKGYDPFKYKEQQFLKLQQQIDPAKEWTCMQALNYFTQEWEQKGLEGSYLTKLKRAKDLLVEWLTARNWQNEPVGILTKKHIKAALQEASAFNKWENRTYNNNLTALNTVFNFLSEEKILVDKPTKGIDAKKAPSKKHRYFDEEQFEAIIRVSKKEDRLLHFALKLVYYLCIRAEKELKWFRVGNIFLDRRQVMIQAAESKTDVDRYIAIPDELMDDLTHIRKNYPLNYYVIGKGHLHKKYVRDNAPSPEPFPNNMISARFAKLRQKIPGLTSDHTPYGMKHTRIIHLKIDSARGEIKITDADIMGLTGQTSFEAYSKYLRDIGMEGNSQSVNRISRKF